MARIALVFLNTVLLLALVEGAARIAERVHPDRQEIAFGYAPYRMLKMTKAPWALDSEGFRAGELGTYRGKFLVEFLGASACLGVGTDPGETVPERLERALRQAGLGHAAVLNLCQGGATSAQELAIFVEYGLPLHPQVVLSYDGANDTMHPRPLGGDDGANLPYRNAELQSRLNGNLDLLPHLALFRVAQRLRSRTSFEPPHGGEAVPLDRILESYFYSLEVVGTLAEAQGGYYAVVLQPTLHLDKFWSGEEKTAWHDLYPRGGEQVSRDAHDRYAAARTAMIRWSRDRGESLFDLTGVFADTRETIYSDSVHFHGERGYAMLEAELEQKGLVERIAERYRDWEKLGAVDAPAVSSTAGDPTMARESEATDVSTMQVNTHPAVAPEDAAQRRQAWLHRP